MNITQEILSDIVVYNKYAKYLPKKQRRETWKELVTRNKKMHQENLVHQFKCAFCGLVHDKIELGSFSIGYPTSLKFEDDFSVKLKGKNSIIKGTVYRE